MSSKNKEPTKIASSIAEARVFGLIALEGTEMPHNMPRGIGPSKVLEKIGDNAYEFTFYKETGLLCLQSGRGCRFEHEVPIIGGNH